MNIRLKVEKTLLSIIRHFSARYGYGTDTDSLVGFLTDIRNFVGNGEGNRLFDNGTSELYSANASARALAYIQKARTVIFPLEQILVFAEIRNSPTDAVEYRLPYPEMFIQFSRPLRQRLNDDDPEEANILGFLLVQSIVDRDEYESVSKEMKKNIVPIRFLDGQEIFLNILFVFAQNGDMAALSDSTWQSDIVHHDLYGGAGMAAFYRDLAVACIGYINCENVYLEKQGEVDEAINRKREAKGKSRLEPYYVCRIRGVQYDSHATGEGSKHGIRYDVRGHFRRLETGKTIWVRPHQRGLQNELYVPKVYKVEKGSKPEWKA